ncbi:MAG: hypothetical protein BMS9Abin29_0851 [Gemmatimonadota bacterium]|nr:MAG: hypothetical protein BMS9Abin29_0851 [Gemmatimonadota bacterium]
MKCARQFLALIAGMMVVMPSGLAAQDNPRPIELSLFSPVQIMGPEADIAGIRLSLYGRNASMQGLDFSIIGHTTGVTKGVQFGLVGIAEGGFQGFQNTAVNISGGPTAGFQLGLYNDAASGEVLQIGVFNRIGSGSGFMLGVVNWADDFEGLQIGILNIIEVADGHVFLPIVNWRF